MLEAPVGRIDGEMPVGSAMAAESLESLRLEVARLTQANEQLQDERDQLERQLMTMLPRQGDPPDVATIGRLTEEVQVAQARLELAEADYRAAVDIIRAMVTLL